MDSGSNAQKADDPETEVIVHKVFFCSECRTIVGDSYSWLGDDPGSHTISLSDISESVVLSDDLETSRSGFDIGSVKSTYSKLYCNLCKNELGKIYRTTPRTLDHIRDMYTFSLDKIGQYQMGSKETISQLGLLSLEMVDIPSIRTLQTHIRKVQRVICHLHQRLDSAENQLSQLAAKDPSQ